MAMSKKPTEIDALNQLVLSLYDIAQSESFDSFQQHAFKHISGNLSYESGFSVSGDFSNPAVLKISAVSLYRLPVEKLRERQQITDSDPVLTRAKLHPGKTVRATFSEFPGITDEYRKHAKRFEQFHGLTIFRKALKAHQDDEVISMFRRDSRMEFSDFDCKLADYLLPHFYKAKEINLRIQRLENAQNVQEVNVIATRGGLIHFTEPAIVALMQTEWRQWEPPFIPNVMLAALLSNAAGGFIGKRINASARVEGELLMIRCSLRNPRSSLTNAELQVARLAAQGSAYKEIAKTMHVSPATVRNQLHSIYGKLDIKNKSALFEALQQCHYL